MRSIKEFNVESLKCTILQHNMKYSLLIEDEAYQMTIKLGDQAPEKINKIEDAMKSPHVLRHVAKSLSAMHDTRIFVEKEIKDTEDEDEEIII